jgi:branched-chain amino acid transport system ATP-binding protein
VGITTLFPKLTVLDNVLLAVQGLRAMKFVMWRPLTSYRAIYARAQALLEQAGYWDRRDIEIRHLSHGEQRQIEIVLALASDPHVLLLDEPAAGLSSGESHEMATFLQGLDPALAILMIEHDMDVAFAVVDSITVLHYGEIVAEGSRELIRTSTRVRDIYLGTG